MLFVVTVPIRYLPDTYQIPTSYQPDTYQIPTRYQPDTYRGQSAHCAASDVWFVLPALLPFTAAIDQVNGCML